MVRDEGRHLKYSVVHVRDSWRLAKCILSNGICRYITYSTILTFVDPCIIVQFIKKNPTRCNNVQKFTIIPYFYEAQHVSSDTPPIIKSLKLHWQPLVLHTWKVVGRVVGGHCQAQNTVPDNIHQLHAQTTFHVCKTRGCQCSFRLLMMGGVSPETCWAS